MLAPPVLTTFWLKPHLDAGTFLAGRCDRIATSQENRTIPCRDGRKARMLLLPPCQECRSRATLRVRELRHLAIAFQQPWNNPRVRMSCCLRDFVGFIVGRKRRG